MCDRLMKWLGIGIVIAIVVLFAGVICVDVVQIEGYEVGVVHKWWGGVQDKPLRDGLHFVWWGKCVKINIGTQKITFAKQLTDDVAGKDTADNEYDRIELSCGSSGGQKAWAILTAVYHLDPGLAVQLYKDNLHKTYRYVVMKRTIIEVVNKLARPQEALVIYSGVGFNTLKDNIDKEVQTHDVLVSRGIVVENCTLYDIELDDAYETEIQDKQLAKQKKLRAIEETSAAVEEAKKTKAEQQIMVEKRTAEAQAKKIEVVTQAEGSAEQEVLKATAAAKQVTLAAEAEKEQSRLRGEGEKLMKIAQADGERALGLAEAEVEKAKRDAMYADAAGAIRAQVEIAQHQASLVKNALSVVKVIPSDLLSAFLSEYIGDAAILPSLPVAPKK